MTKDASAWYHLISNDDYLSFLSGLNVPQLRLTYFARSSGVVLHMPIGI